MFKSVENNSVDRTWHRLYKQRPRDSSSLMTGDIDGSHFLYDLSLKSHYIPPGASPQQRIYDKQILRDKYFEKASTTLQQ